MSITSIFQLSSIAFLPLLLQGCIYMEYKTTYEERSERYCKHETRAIKHRRNYRPLPDDSNPDPNSEIYVPPEMPSLVSDCIGKETTPDLDGKDNAFIPEKEKDITSQ